MTSGRIAIAIGACVVAAFGAYVVTDTLRRTPPAIAETPSPISERSGLLVAEAGAGSEVPVPQRRSEDVDMLFRPTAIFAGRLDPVTPERQAPPVVTEKPETVADERPAPPPVTVTVTSKPVLKTAMLEKSGPPDDAFRAEHASLKAAPPPNGIKPSQPKPRDGNPAASSQRKAKVIGTIKQARSGGSPDITGSVPRKRDLSTAGKPSKHPGKAQAQAQAQAQNLSQMPWRMPSEFAPRP